MIKTFVALSLTLAVASCVTPEPLVVDKNVYIAVALDDGFFTEDNCPIPPKPPTGKDGTEIKDTELASTMTELYGNNKTCRNTLDAIKQKNKDGIEKVNRLNTEK